MEAPAKTAKKKARTGASDGEFEEKVRRRAYELYEQRGREHGRDVEDWLEAEAELSAMKTETARKSRKTPAATGPGATRISRPKKTTARKHEEPPRVE